MVRSLVVHHDETLLSRIQKESGGSAITSPNLVHAIRYLSSDQVPYSAIYVPVDDLSYSLLKFIEAARMRRPLTPIYVIHKDDLDPSPINALNDETLATGWVNAESTYQEWTKNLNPISKKTEITPRAVVTRENQRQGFLPVPTTDLVEQASYPYDLFLLGEDGGLRLFSIADTDVDLEYLRKASESSNFIYLHEDQQKEYRTKIHTSQKHFMDLNSIPAAWKNSELLFRAKSLSQELKQGGLSDGLLDQAGEMLASLFKLVNDLHGKDPESLTELILRAQNADRTFTCVMFSFLMCRIMGFEKNSTVEILGMASFFQDIGLFETAFGDLSKKKFSQMSEDEKSEYLRHPIRSVDIIEQHVTFPQVTLQVIRQAHERKDRTGFPNRVQPTQLHPMAEVLSLINSYVDFDPETNGNFANYLKDKVFPHYSDRVLEPFKKVLKSLARD